MVSAMLVAALAPLERALSMARTLSFCITPKRSITRGSVEERGRSGHRVEMASWTAATDPNGPTARDWDRSLAVATETALSAASLAGPERARAEQAPCTDA